MTDAAIAPAPGTAEAPVLDLVLYPNPPLGRYGVGIVMGAAGMVLGGLGIGFAAIGAWPVSGFLGLDIVLLWAALAETSRRSRRTELIRLDRRGLIVSRLGPAGDLLHRIRLEPTWVQVVLDERRRHDPRLSLRAHGTVVPIGRFLAAVERRELAYELREALAAYRGARVH